MKPKVIVGVIAIIGFTSLLMWNFSESINSYASFKKAGDLESAHVVGTWVSSKDYGFSFKEKQFTFYMKDEKGNVRKVIYPKPKPNNFEKAKKLVVIGSMHNGVFYAQDMLMKCPSKYNSLEEGEFKEAYSGKKMSKRS